MHYTAMEYVLQACRDFVVGFPYQRVVEFGSYDVNGSIKGAFPEAKVYVGVDRRKGRGVDVVSDAVDYDGKGLFDIVVTTEMLEHAPDPVGVIRSAWRALRPGGMLILTAAAPERQPHSNDGNHVLAEGEFYGGIHPDELREWLSDWDVLSLQHRPDCGDVYATAVKPL